MDRTYTWSALGLGRLAADRPLTTRPRHQQGSTCIEAHHCQRVLEVSNTSLSDSNIEKRARAHFVKTGERANSCLRNRAILGRGTDLNRLRRHQRDGRAQTDQGTPGARGEETQAGMGSVCNLARPDANPSPRRPGYAVLLGVIVPRSHPRSLECN